MLSVRGRVTRGGPFQGEYVLKRVFHKIEVARIATLAAEARTRELRELMGGVLVDGARDRALFKMDHAFRSPLRDLVTDAMVGTEATRVLAFVGVPEDLRWLAEHLPATRKTWVENWWAYDLVSAMLEPATEMQWSFLKRCVSGEYDGPGADALDVTAAAIQSLEFIASPRSLQILEELRPQNERLASLTSQAIAYVKSKPDPLLDRNLVELGTRVAAAAKLGEWRRNRAPEYNERRDKAFMDLEFGEGRERIIFTGAFHEVGGVWKLRGLRLALANPSVMERVELL